MPHSFPKDDPSPDRLLIALNRLNQIGAAINATGGENHPGIQATLELIVKSATALIPASSAVLYTYSESEGQFDPASRVSAEGPLQEKAASVSDDFPRPSGLGMRAVQQKRRVLSYDEPGVTIHPGKVQEGAMVMSCFPLIVADVVLGVLYVYRHEESTFSTLELLLLENFVNQAGLTLSLARQIRQAQQDQTRKERELRRLRRAGMLISSRQNLQETLETILAMALDVINAQYGIFRLVDPSGELLITQAVTSLGLSAPATEALPIDRSSVMGLAAVDRKPIVISDLLAPEWESTYYPLDAMMQMRSEIAVPLIGAGERLIGVLNLESPIINSFDKQDQYILQILAAQASTAIQEANLLDTLQQISASLVSGTLPDILNQLAAKASSLLNCPTGLIWIRQGETLHLGASTEGYFQPVQVPIENTLTGKAVLTGKPVTAHDLQQEKAFFSPDLAIKNNWGSAIIIPIQAPNTAEILGCFAVYTHEQDLRDFAASGWESKVLAILAHYAYLAIQISRHQEALRSIQEQHAIAETFAAVGDISANLMHRLNNKVGVIPVRVEGLQDRYPELLAEHVYLSENIMEIQRSAQEAMQIVRESLFHLNPIQMQPVNLEHCILGAAASTSPSPGIHLQYQNLEKLPSIQADYQRLRLVFTNLIENAIEAMQGTGTLILTGIQTPGWVEILVNDSGPGITPELHEKIFEFNYSSGAAHQPGKLGFGLWWIKTLLVRMGGSISVRSDGLTGTTFHLRFPEVNPGGEQ